MARAGLGEDWSCLFANDFNPMKAATYIDNWGEAHFKLSDIASLTVDDLPEQADLAWASFPCQDLSLAGNGEGIGDEAGKTRSGSFWSFWNLMQQMQAAGKSPSVIVLENVYGSLTSNNGRDFAAICRSLSLGGYHFGALLIDAVLFVPQSRSRVFIIAVRDDLPRPEWLTCDGPSADWHPPAMISAIERLSEPDLAKWCWWHLPLPEARFLELEDIIESEPVGVDWHSKDETEKLVALMNSAHKARLLEMQKAGKPTVGTIYKRMRVGENRKKYQRAELRWDGIAGCLRTPGGGSSRQTIIAVDGSTVKSRLLSPREAARLMGLPDSYKLPKRYNDAYHVAGDGLVVPVVNHLSKSLLIPLFEVLHHPLAIAAE